jgi:hypothetical protein
LGRARGGVCFIFSHRPPLYSSGAPLPPPPPPRFASEMRAYGGWKEAGKRDVLFPNCNIRACVRAPYVYPLHTQGTAPIDSTVSYCSRKKITPPAPLFTNLLTFSLCWNFRTIYGGQEPSRNRVVAPSRQATL